MRPHGIPTPQEPTLSSDFEGLALLDLRSSEPAPPSPPRRLPAELPSIDIEIERGEEPPIQEDGWDWSYDPLVPLRAGAAEPALRGARLPDEDLRESLSWRELASTAARDTTNRRSEHFLALQRAMFLTQLPTWAFESRLLWLERHELFLKLYGDDDEWP